MNQTAITQHLSEMREKYLDKKSACDMAQGRERSRKMVKIKKKLVTLERERCQKLLGQRDPSQIDAKIEEQKKLYSQCCRQK
ncbi:hypothetical protein [Streptococcus macacae]|uniref:Uncharacterized protein n=1 Tax=Streptococcus macacae NCTC 11558 TaxID=764298 RepID=G5JYA1_9STRE|nr:hypothetical protein [Streptococcus macacae]EHJ52805.1 hypothetical protein STRMA_0162 [Streptococcus macacae NCTC 11558]SUN78015.1 Uncharacterised protein [Streptococcus macacae NCTC 11558]